MAPSSELAVESLSTSVDLESYFARCHSAEWPESTPELLDRARGLADGNVYFYDSEPIAVGLEGIDWEGGHRQHQEWRSQLNRFGYLVTLAVAWRETEDPRFPAAARAYISDWMNWSARCERDRGKPFYTHALDASIRIGTSHFMGWGGALQAFRDSDLFDADFQKQVLTSLGIQLQQMANDLTSCGNMRVSEFDTLVFTGLRYPHLRDSGCASEVALRGLRNALASQFLSDGAHCELCPSYARWMVRVLADYAMLEQALPELKLGIDHDRLAGALAYIAHGEAFAVNDCWRVAEPIETLQDLSLAKRLLKRLDAKYEGWEPPRLSCFSEAGQVFLRSDWSPLAESVGFDAGFWSGSHAHTSRLAFNYRAGGRELIADPGILDYEMSNPLAPYGKSTRAHSTLCLDNLNQGATGADLRRALRFERGALLHARYDGGYWDGAFTWGFREGCGQGIHGIHDRILFWLEGEYLLILDCLGAHLGHTVCNHVQLGHSSSFHLSPDRLSCWTDDGEINVHAQLVGVPKDTEVRLTEGELDPPSGWLGGTFQGARVAPAPHLEYRYPAGVPAGGISALLIQPFLGSRPPNVTTVRHLATSNGGSQFLELNLGNGRHDCIGWSPKLLQAVEVGDEVQSDGSFFWLRTEDGVAVEGAVLQGSYIWYPSLSNAEWHPNLTTWRNL